MIKSCKQAHNTIGTFAEMVLLWFDKSGRKNLPWQQNISPYRVWISEIMLQQTQVVTVINYFQRFLSVFPDVTTLAKAPLDDVLHLWTGLGYYARARNLHKSAKIITEQFNGIFPNDLTTLLTLPGIGRSTAGAILSIAFQKATAILDGNVKRVLTRFATIAGYPGQQEVEKKLWQLAERYTPINRCADYTQAIMDIGATICTRSQPKCPSCPLQNHCQAYQKNQISHFPSRKLKTTLKVKQTQFLILINDQQQCLLVKRPVLGIWGGLWSFPECHCDQDAILYCQATLGYSVTLQHQGQPFRHTFSHFHLDITPVYLKVRDKPLRLEENEIIWGNFAQLPKIGLAAPVVKLLHSYPSLILGVDS